MHAIRRSFVLAVLAWATFGGPGPAHAADAPPPPPAPPPSPPAVPPAAPPAAPAPPPAAPPAHGFDFPEPGEIRRPDGTNIYFYRTNFVKAADLVAAVKNLLQLPGVELKDFPRQNQVLVQGTPEAIETALDAFAYFDVPEPQVFVEAKIVEVTYDNNFEFGLSALMDRDVQGPNTFFRGGATTLNPPSFFRSQQPGNLPFQGTSLAFGFVGEMAEKYGLFDLTWQALLRNGQAEILSRPSIVATQGVPASVKTGQKTPIINLRTAQSIAPNPALPQGGEQLFLETSYVETKIGLDVTAMFVGDGFVTLDVSPTVSNVTGFSVGEGGTSAPIISERTAKTTVTMADADTLIIGGLYTTSTLKDTAKIPLISDIPGLGYLFTRVKDTHVKVELMFFITPHILRKQADYKIISPPAEKERLEKGTECPQKPCCPKPFPFQLPSASADPVR